MSLKTRVRNLFTYSWREGIETKSDRFAKEFIEETYRPGTRRHFSSREADRGLTLDQLVSVTDNYLDTNVGNSALRFIKRLSPTYHLVLNEDLRKQVAFSVSRVLEEMANDHGHGQVFDLAGHGYYTLSADEIGGILKQTTHNKRVKAAVIGLFNNLHAYDTDIINPGRTLIDYSANHHDFANTVNKNMYNNWIERYLVPDDRIQAMATTAFMVSTTWSGYAMGSAAAGAWAGLGQLAKRYVVPKLTQTVGQGVCNFIGDHASSPYARALWKNVGASIGMAALTGNATLSTGLLIAKGINSALIKREGSSFRGYIGSFIDAVTDYGLIGNAVYNIPGDGQHTIKDIVDDNVPYVKQGFAEFNEHVLAPAGEKISDAWDESEPVRTYFGNGIDNFQNFYFPWVDDVPQWFSDRSAEFNVWKAEAGAAFNSLKAEAGRDIAYSWTQIKDGWTNDYKDTGIPTDADSIRQWKFYEDSLNESGSDAGAGAGKPLYMLTPPEIGEAIKNTGIYKGGEGFVVNTAAPFAESVKDWAADRYNSIANNTPSDPPNPTSGKFSEDITTDGHNIYMDCHGSANAHYFAEKFGNHPIIFGPSPDGKYTTPIYLDGKIICTDEAPESPAPANDNSGGNPGQFIDGIIDWFSGIRLPSWLYDNDNNGSVTETGHYTLTNMRINGIADWVNGAHSNDGELAYHGNGSFDVHVHDYEGYGLYEMMRADPGIKGYVMTNNHWHEIALGSESNRINYSLADEGPIQQLVIGKQVGDKLVSYASMVY